jgi:hypothetical protein
LRPNPRNPFRVAKKFIHDDDPGFQSKPWAGIRQRFQRYELENNDNADGLNSSSTALRNSHPLFSVKAGNVAMRMTAVRSKRVTVQRRAFTEID